MHRAWIKRACIKSPSIACDGDPPVTHADFDNISPIWREYNRQYHGEHTYTTLPKTAQCADFCFILAICP
jgi:hypothetical protein